MTPSNAVLEFIGLAEKPHYTKTEIDTALLDHLRAFLPEGLRP